LLIICTSSGSHHVSMRRVYTGAFSRVSFVFSWNVSLSIDSSRSG
jgi:hypothetical protein